MRTDEFFKALFGFVETGYHATQKRMLDMCELRQCSGAEMAVFCNPYTKQRITSGWHSTPSVAELRREVAETVASFEGDFPGRLCRWRQETKVTWPADAGTGGDSFPPIRCGHIVGEAGAMHNRFPAGLFQAASQFNLLEFISPDVVPECGIANYIHDLTQGPACAVACMGGTAYRNYMVHPSLFHRSNDLAPSPAALEAEHRGQTQTRQINTLSDVMRFIGTGDGASRAEGCERFFRIQNGYFFAGPQLSSLLSHATKMAALRQTTLEKIEEEMIHLLRIGRVDGASVTLPLTSPTPSGTHQGPVELPQTSQTYNSALSLPCSSSPVDASTEWLARTVLKGSYEATMLVGVLHTLKTIRAAEEQAGDGVAGKESFSLPPIFLTKVGGGVFYNKPEWIAEAIAYGLSQVGGYGVPLDVKLVHFNSVDEYYESKLAC